MRSTGLLARKSDCRESTLKAMGCVWRRHVAPTLGARDVTATTREDVIDLIASTEGSSALKVRKLSREIGALAVSLGWLAASPAGPEIDTALPTAAKRTGAGRRRAMPAGDVGEWLRSLAAGSVGNAIRMLALTATRLNDVLGCEWGEIDGDVWTVPGGRHKSGSDFRVPLSGSVLAILAEQRGQDARFVFPSLRLTGRPVSDETLRKAGHPDYDLHGLRSSFSTWAADNEQDRDTTETALSHAVGSAVARKYQRSDLLDQRRTLMTTWGRYLAP